MKKNINYNIMVEVLQKVSASTISMQSDFNEEEIKYLKLAKEIGLLSYKHGDDDLNKFLEDNMAIVLDAEKFGYLHIIKKHELIKQEFNKGFDVLEVLLRMVYDKNNIYKIGQKDTDKIEDALIIMGSVPNKFLESVKSEFLKVVFKKYDVKTQYIKSEKTFYKECSKIDAVSEEYSDYIYEILMNDKAKKYIINDEGRKVIISCVEKPEDTTKIIDQKIDARKNYMERKSKYFQGREDVDDFVARTFKQLKNGTKISDEQQQKITKSAKVAGIPEERLFLSDENVFSDGILDYSENLKDLDIEEDKRSKKDIEGTNKLEHVNDEDNLEKE